MNIISEDDEWLCEIGYPTIDKLSFIIENKDSIIFIDKDLEEKIYEYTR